MLTVKADSDLQPADIESDRVQLVRAVSPSKIDSQARMKLNPRVYRPKVGGHEGGIF